MSSSLESERREQTRQGRVQSRRSFVRNRQREGVAVTVTCPHGALGCSAKQC
jgi:hypothetical protein